ncbi:hypothetical protein CLOM_g16777 [Closterium sp. NIES-68]|nr:hypothetical protein CLOM_g16777 [Closterium sp. NIES-68]
MARLVLSKPLAVKTGHGLAAQPLSRLPLLLALLVASCRSPPVPCACALSQLGRGAIQRHARLVARTRSHGGCNYLKGSWVDTSTIPGYSPPYSPSCSQFSCADVAEGHTNPSSFVWQPFPPCSYDLWRDNLVYSFRCTLSAATPFKYVRLSVGNYRYRNALLLPSYTSL